MALDSAAEKLTSSPSTSSVLPVKKSASTFCGLSRSVPLMSACRSRTKVS